eukprot:TRINITY_DN3454_c0_g1_i3.p1 TRINITY_DN3454_c0_g1~~TRINITY_DN3454_c0_g1_i3.p1  ORF type:complete len:539 (+),score=70.21 TRINITY_DN3454_c0_g1_i3:77-1693(+)
MALSQHEQLAIGCAISLLLHACRLARSAWPMMKSFWIDRSSVLDLAKRWLARTSESSALDDYVSNQVKRQLVSNLQEVIGVVAHAFNLLLCFTLFHIMSSAQLRLAGIQLWAVIIIGACSTIGCMVPALVNRHTVHVWYAGLLLGCSFIIGSSSTTSAEEILGHSFLFMSARAVLSSNYSNFTMIVVWNCVYSATAIYAVANALDSNRELGVDNSLRLPGVIAVEIGAFVAILYLSRTTVASLKREIRHQAQATCLQGENAATTQLLDVMCEIVVELDSEQRIAVDSERFAAMFALNHTRAMKGKKLQDLMPLDEDRKNVDEILLTMSRNTERKDPRLAHVTLRDSYGTQFRAELFFVQFSGLDRSSRYYVGIQENRDAPVAELRTNRSSQRRAGPSVTSTDAEDIEQNAGLGSSEMEVNPSDSSQSLGDSPCEPLLHPHFKRTTKEAQELSLMVALVSWNFVVPPRRCCVYHAAMEEMMRIVKPLEQRACNSDFKPDLSAQCSHCGILDEWENVRDSFQCAHCSRLCMTRGSRMSSL